MTTTPSATANRPPAWQPYFILACGLLATSAAAILIRFAQNDGAPSLVISAWRLGLATLVLTPIVLLRHRTEIAQLNRQQILLAALAGIMLVIHFASWITSLEYTSVLISVVLVTTNPLFVALLSPLLLRERISAFTLVAVFLAMIGGIVITAAGDAGSAPKQDQPLLGAALAMLGSISVALYFIIGRRLRATITIIPYIWLTYGAGAIGLILLMLISGQAQGLIGLPASAYLWMTLVMLFPQLIGHSSYNYALGYLSAAFVSLCVLFEPIGSTILAVFFLNEQPKPLQIVGGILILVALVVASREERRKSTYNAVETVEAAAEL